MAEGHAAMALASPAGVQDGSYNPTLSYPPVPTSLQRASGSQQPTPTTTPVNPLTDWIGSAHCDTAKEQELQRMVSDLEVQVLELRAKLDAAHCSDANSLYRAHKTLTQHIQVLRIESKHIVNLIQSLETTSSVISPDWVSKELGYMMAVTAAAWSVDRSLKWTRLPSSPKLMAVSAAALIVWRLVRSTSSRVATALGRNTRTRAKLLQDWKTVQERIDILCDLAQYQPQLQPEL